MDIHNKIIVEVGNATFLPHGFFQRGKSRTWLYDCGYCVVLIEFQPSAYSRGSFCNVGIDFLFDTFTPLYSTLCFSYGWKRIHVNKSGFVEYVGNDSIFREEIFKFATYALKYAESLIKFQSLNYANWEFVKLLCLKRFKALRGKWNGPVHDYYYAAMIKFLIGNYDSGVRILQKWNLRNGTRDEWMNKIYMTFCESNLTANQAKSIVVEMVNKRRKLFQSKPSYKKLEGEFLL